MLVQEGEEIPFAAIDPRPVQSITDPEFVGAFGLEPAERLLLPGALSAISPVWNIRCSVRSSGAQPSWARRILLTCAAVRSGFSFFSAIASSTTSGGVRGWDWRGEGTRA